MAHALALGGMIGNASGLNPDKLALDLQFSTDKTLTARKGPTPTFTRGSGDNGGTTYVGERLDYDGEALYQIHSISNGRFGWATNNVGFPTYIFSYTGTRWQASLDTGSGPVIINAAIGTEYSPEKANWSGTSVTEFQSSGDFVVLLAVNNQPRFDHDPITGVCNGLLIEESRTNLIIRSSDFANASWTKGGGSISSVANTSPDGSASSELFSEDSTMGAHRVFQSFSGTIGTVYTLSVFLKYAGRQQVFLENRSIGTNPYVVFDIQNGTIVTTVGALTSTIQAYPNGWYRCSVTGTATAAGGNYLIGGYLSGSQTYTGVNGPSFHTYGAQVEAGSFPTSYIPTTTGTAIRSADVCSISGSSFTTIWNGTNITVLYKGVRSGATSGSYWALTSGTLATTIASDRGTTTERLAASGTGIISFTGLPANQSIRTAYAIKQSDYAGSLNGGAVTTSSSSFVPTFNTFYIGSGYTVVTGASWISEIKTYSKRLANAKLQAITV